MNDNALRLRQLLIRNFNEVALERFTREPLYDTRCARLSTGTAALKQAADYPESKAQANKLLNQAGAK